MVRERSDTVPSEPQALRPSQRPRKRGRTAERGLQRPAPGPDRAHPRGNAGQRFEAEFRDVSWEGIVVALRGDRPASPASAMDAVASPARSRRYAARYQARRSQPPEVQPGRFVPGEADGK